MQMKKFTGYPSIDQIHKREERFFEKHPVIPNISIYGVLRLLSSSYRNDVAINCDGRTATFSHLLRDAFCVSNGLIALGIQPGEIITVCMPNIYQSVVLFFAANRVGITVTFLNEFSTCEEIQHYLKFFNSPLLINYGEGKRFNRELIQCTDVKHIVTLHESEKDFQVFNKSFWEVDVTQSLLHFRDLYALGKRRKYSAKILFSGNRNALILFTSGTTGTPKSVVLTNRNILAAAVYLKNSSHISNARGEKSLVCVPFTYPYGFCTSLLMSLLCGRQAILAPQLSIDTIGYYLNKQPNIIFGSPALLEVIMRGIPECQDLSSVTTFISGGDYLSMVRENEGRKFFARHGGKVSMCNGTGNAETTSCGTNSVGTMYRAGSAGRILSGADAIIIDPVSRKELQYGEEGLLCVSGKHVFKEYYNEPEMTTAARWKYKRKTYFPTGMLGFLDKDGYFTITGREARFYITSSLNKVYCDRVQNIIAAIDGISMCAVVEVPDKKDIFSSKAFIVLETGIQPTEETLEYIMKSCAEPIMMAGTNTTVQLKQYEIPKDFIFLKELPRAKSGKVDYNALKKYIL